ncbi:hypothetical protein ACLOJK_030945 [Asimina triloba]
MLECLNGGGFSSKWFVSEDFSWSSDNAVRVFDFTDVIVEVSELLCCFLIGGCSKSRIKLIRSRVEVITRKKNATLKYLKKDIAELIQNGLDTHAYGRVSVDLAFSLYLNSELAVVLDLFFVEGLIKEMNHTACYELIEQFCVCILGQLSSMKKQRECPPECREAVSSLMFAAARFADLPELYDLRSIFTERYGNLLECVTVNQEFSKKIASKPSSMEQKLNLMRDISQEFALNWDPKTYRERNSNPPLALPYNQPKLLEAVHDGKDHNVFKTQMQEIPSKQRQDVSLAARYGARQEVKTENKMDIICHNKKGLQSPALDVDHGRSLAEKVKPCVADSMVLHARQEVKADNKTSHPFNSNASKRLASDLTRESAGGLKLQSAENIAPPYIKAKDSNYLSKPEIQHPSPGHDESAILPICYKDDLCTESMRKAGSDFNSHKRHGYGRPPNGCQDEIDSRGNPVGDHTHKPRSMRRHLKPQGHKSDSAADGMEYGSRTPNGKTRQHTGLSILTQLDDEEEMVMDELLMHYSKTPSSTWKSNTILTGQKVRSGQKAPIYRVKDAGKPPQMQNKDGSDSAHETGLPARALSLPSESTASKEEVSKVPVRAASLQNTKGTHVHPKLPDYDDLAARFAAFKREGCKVK